MGLPAIASQKRRPGLRPLRRSAFANFSGAKRASQHESNYARTDHFSAQADAEGPGVAKQEQIGRNDDGHRQPFALRGGTDRQPEFIHQRSQQGRVVLFRTACEGQTPSFHRELLQARTPALPAHVRRLTTRANKARLRYGLAWIEN